MRYYVTVEGRTFEVDLREATPRIDGRPVRAELRDVPGTLVRHLLADGHSMTLVVQPGEARGHWRIQVRGRRFDVDVVDERTRAIREMTGRSGSARGPKPVRAPMPGLVLRVQVEPGQTVRPGQGVVIVEAMKMENELKAETGGVVSKVHVTIGQAVEKGTVLVELEAD